MTIKIQAYQSNGIKTDEVIDEFEFCCWDKLFKWLKKYKELHKCPKCKKPKKYEDHQHIEKKTGEIVRKLPTKKEKKHGRKER